MQLDDLPVGHAGALVQAVDVLGDHRRRDAAADERRDGAVAPVRLRVRHRVVTLGPQAPRLAPRRLRGDEVAEVDRPPPRPDTPGAAEIGDPGFGADARAGEHHGAAGVFDEAAQPLQIRIAGDGGAHRPAPGALPGRPRSSPRTGEGAFGANAFGGGRSDAGGRRAGTDDPCSLLPSGHGRVRPACLGLIRGGSALRR